MFETAALQLPLGALIALLVVGVAGLMLLGLILHRQQQTRGDTGQLATLAGQVATQQATLTLVDQRLAQLQAQLASDHAQLREQIGTRLDALKHALEVTLGDNRAQLAAIMSEHRTRVEEQNGRALLALQDSMRAGFDSLHQQLGESLLRNSTDLGQRVEALTRVTGERLQEIGGQVDKRLADGFEKTTATFTEVVTRLALIDEAQKKITALSTDVVSLQQLLSDKRARGAFGEVQLNALVANVLPPASYAFQHRLSNDKIVDCVLFLPAPTGTICIDSKFPLESYRVITDNSRSEIDRKRAELQFKQDIRKHIKDIGEKYVVRDETADGAIMFIPAEAVFAEIQAHHPDLVEMAQTNRVWMASPTTLWAILNTAAAVLKDAARREQVDLIQQHLGHLADDFQRFRVRMDRLASHIQQANKDVDEVNISARKISDRFEKIERVELDETEVSKPVIRQVDETGANDLP